MNGSSDSWRMLFLSPASEPPIQFVTDILFTLYVAARFALPARPPSSPTSTHWFGCEQWSQSGRQSASFLCCFTSGHVVLGPYSTIFSQSQLPKPLDMFAVCAFRHRRGSSKLFLASFYVKCFGWSANGTSCFEENGGCQLWRVYSDELQDNQEWFFSVKKSSGRKHADISHPLKRNNFLCETDWSHAAKS